MVLPDVNILVYAFRRDSEHHAEAFSWLQETLDTPSTFGMSDIAASGFLRIVTHPGIFKNPDTVEDAFGFIETIMKRPNCVVVRPGPRHWDIFQRLCRDSRAKGNLIPDAFFAALAVEHGCEWITTDRDYSRFPGLKTIFL